jgi:hypothetical protein
LIQPRIVRRRSSVVEAHPMDPEGLEAILQKRIAGMIDVHAGGPSDNLPEMVVDERLMDLWSRNYLEAENSFFSVAEATRLRPACLAV